MPHFSTPSPAWNSDSYIDLGHFCDRLVVECGAESCPELAEAALDVLGTLEAARVCHGAGCGGYSPAYYQPADGISIYYPDGRPDLVDGDDYYLSNINEAADPAHDADLAFVADTRWDHIIRAILGDSPAGDLDGDGQVNLDDHAIFMSNLDGPGVGSYSYLDGDLDGDGDVDMEDWRRLQATLEAPMPP